MLLLPGAPAATGAGEEKLKQGEPTGPGDAKRPGPVGCWPMPAVEGVKPRAPDWLEFGVAGVVVEVALGEKGSEDRGAARAWVWKLEMRCRSFTGSSSTWMIDLRQEGVRNGVVK